MSAKIGKPSWTTSVSVVFGIKSKRVAMTSNDQAMPQEERRQ